MEQNSSSWLKWRNEGIGASDAPIILGLSKYKSPKELWAEKIGEAKCDDKPTFIQEKGHILEKKARALLELSMDHDFPAKIVQHKSIPILRASLDGYNEESETIFEGKFVGQEKFDTVVKTGKPLPEHYPQVQHQLAVSGAECCIYMVYTSNKSMDLVDSHMVEVYPVPDYIEKLLRIEAVFWESVVAKEYRFSSDRDLAEEENMSTDNLAIFRDKMAALNKLKKETEDLKAIITKELHGKNFENDYLKITKSTRKGAVNYKKVLKFHEIECDLEEFREKSSESYRFTLK